MSFATPNNNNQLVNVSMLVERPCPSVAPLLIPYFSPIGWNAVLVGLLSSILAIIFLLTCIYYFICRRRYFDETTDGSSVALVNKNGVPVTSMETTTFTNEPGKETKMLTTGTPGTNDFIVGMTNVGNGHTGSSGTNGLLANGSADPSELRLLQHEHH